MIDRVTDIFNKIVQDEASRGETQKDQFGDGSNIRIWNSLEKLALESPEDYVNYFSNDVLAAASRAWLGPFY